jgi:arabinogalactan oligomer / maltooligosaccharide transport system substrate-binding protein
MRRISTLASVLAAAAVIGTAVPTFAQDPVAFTLWTKDGTADGGLQFVQKLATDYMAAHPGVTITVVNKDVEKLRQDFLTTSLAHQAPEMLWTAADHSGPFTASGTIQPVDGLTDLSVFLPQALQPVQLDGQTWGLPVSFGNHLMLYTNKDLMAECPADSDAWIAAAKAATGNGNYGTVFNQTESFWLIPFLGAYNGSVFAEDGVTATLNTPEMISALTFLKDLKWNQGIMPAEADYPVADGMFKNGAPGATTAAASLAPSATPPPTGVAASIINGDWTLGDYTKLFGDKLNICPIPMITGADWPKPYVAGEYLMFSTDLAKDAAKQAAVVDFANYITGNAQQLDLVSTLKRLPGTAAAFADPVVTGDPLLALSAAAAAHGIGQPSNLEMRCAFDATRTGLKNIFTKQDADPTAVAAQMQVDYDNDASCQ